MLCVLSKSCIPWLRDAQQALVVRGLGLTAAAMQVCAEAKTMLRLRVDVVPSLHRGPWLTQSHVMHMLSCQWITGVTVAPAPGGMTRGGLQSYHCASGPLQTGSQSKHRLRQVVLCCAVLCCVGIPASSAWPRQCSRPWF